MQMSQNNFFNTMCVFTLLWHTEHSLRYLILLRAWLLPTGPYRVLKTHQHPVKNFLRVIQGRGATYSLGQSMESFLSLSFYP